jgi:hypothetical protein
MIDQLKGRERNDPAFLFQNLWLQLYHKENTPHLKIAVTAYPHLAFSQKSKFLSSGPVER